MRVGGSSYACRFVDKLRKPLIGKGKLAREFVCVFLNGYPQGCTRVIHKRPGVRMRVERTLPGAQPLRFDARLFARPRKWSARELLCA